MNNVIDGKRSSPKSVYFHIPFCRHRCGYCNFTLVAGRDYLVDDFLAAIERELSQLTERPSVSTVYFGGGTPSRLPPPAMARMLELVERFFVLQPGAEFTLEANPEDLPGEIADLIAASPVNRISLGVQSFDPQRLRLLDRHHTASQIDRALDSVRSIVERFSVDLIFGLPGDEQGKWQRDLEQAIGSGAGHLSTYELTIEKGTEFWTRQRRTGSLLAADDRLADLYEQTIDCLVGAGFEHYEISSFARPGERSRHNQVYWNGDPYLAFGPGAASLVDHVRTTNHRSVTRYLREVLGNRPAAEESQPLTPFEMAQEQLVFGLRRVEGVDLNAWSNRNNLRLAQVVPANLLDRLVDEGLIVVGNNRIRFTHRGLMVGDHVCQSLLNSGPHSGP
jgi:oxygen-independent coproporphyrinogen-3 oxidase